MKNPQLITKENILKELRKENQSFTVVFISGTNLHPNPKMYKYYWWIYSLESKQENAHEVFYKKEYELTTKEFEKEFQRLRDSKISFAYVNIKLHRLGSIFDYEKLKTNYPDIKFAPSYEDDNDESSVRGDK
ncbi:hypothetical protein [Aliarcobacter butzleri]|uniref:hypothetical protein n=1 Tax=Aliarcobacter butzleri TaxID=28197 RepID=UPI0021B28581|nr:hypothetical protein [Aliarcobacter butzleri]MCT7572802.1 hypothetical protein [Aliarcobacter butzleri]MCT7644590.1 hypothetical protein [Aliarcobacter butzleri]